VDRRPRAGRSGLQLELGLNKPAASAGPHHPPQLRAPRPPRKDLNHDEHRKLQLELGREWLTGRPALELELGREWLPGRPALELELGLTNPLHRLNTYTPHLRASRPPRKEDHDDEHHRRRSVRSGLQLELGLTAPLDSAHDSAPGGATRPCAILHSGIETRKVSAPNLTRMALGSG
jgi:hypothetical protein